MTDAATAQQRTPERDTTRPVPFGRAARSVFDLALEGMVWSRRSLFVAVLLGLPIAFGVLYRAVLAIRIPPHVTAFDLYGSIVALYYVRAFLLPGVLPVVALFYATALISEEVEGKTITYLLTRPIPRTAILFGKFGAYLVTTLGLALPSLVITFFLLTTSGGLQSVRAGVFDLFRDMAVVGLTLAVYGALFTLLGVLLRRPMMLGLSFLLIWELLSLVPSYLPRFTLAAYLRSLVSHRPAGEGLEGLFGQVIPAGLSLFVILGATAAFLAAAAWIFSRREYVLEQ